MKNSGIDSGYVRRFIKNICGKGIHLIMPDPIWAAHTIENVANAHKKLLCFLLLLGSKSALIFGVRLKPIRQCAAVFAYELKHYWSLCL